MSGASPACRCDLGAVVDDGLVVGDGGQLGDAWLGVTGGGYKRPSVGLPSAYGKGSTTSAPHSSGGTWSQVLADLPPHPARVGDHRLAQPPRLVDGGFVHLPPAATARLHT